MQHIIVNVKTQDIYQLTTGDHGIRNTDIQEEPPGSQHDASCEGRNLTYLPISERISIDDFAYVGQFRLEAGLRALFVVDRLVEIPPQSTTQTKNRYIQRYKQLGHQDPRRLHP